MVSDGPVDFGDLLRQLDQVEAMLSEGQVAGDRRRTLMAERARALASPREAPGQDLLPLLVFTLGGQPHAVEVEAVVQVVEARGLQRLVATPSWLLGALLARGRVVPVLDLRQHLGLGPGPGDLTSVLVLEQAGELVGLGVEGLEGRRDVSRHALRAEVPPHRWRAEDGLAVLDLREPLWPRGRT
jgi:purine-binding chemotaxis protein CheW